MKHLILVLVFFLLQCMLFAQQPDDKQWLITDDGYQDSSTTWTQPSGNYSSVYIGGMNFPNVRISDPDIENGVPIARNDFFIIFSDGTHYNGRADNSQIYRIDPTNPIASTNMGYYLNSNSSARTIEYLYASNIYETDDIEEFVNDDGTGIDSQEDIVIEPLAMSGVIIANHDVVKEKDITLIFDLDSIYPKIKHLDQQGIETTFDLCFDVPQGNSISPFNYSQIAHSPVFNNSAGYNIYDVGTLENNCLKDIKFNYSQTYAYLNLAMPLSIGQHKDEVMTFTLNSNDVDFSRDHPEIIRDSHDPNYVEVMCVSNKCGDNIVKYHVECENESISPSGQVTFNMNLPFDFTEVIVTSSFISSVYNTVQDPSDITGRTIKFDFTDEYSLSQNEKAYVEFCVKYDDINVEIDNLQPSYPYTTFGGTEYGIEEYRDILESSDLTVTEDGDRVYYTTINSRNLREDCGCGYICCSGFCCWLRELLGLNKAPVKKSP